MAELNVDPSKDATAFNPADEIDMDVGPAEDGLPEVEWTPSVRGESPTPRDKKFGPLGGTAPTRTSSSGGSRGR